MGLAGAGPARRRSGQPDQVHRLVEQLTAQGRAEHAATPGRWSLVERLVQMASPLQLDDSGRYYISIPANNGMVDYDEYYEIDQTTFERYCADLDSALPFVVRCRNRQEDPRVMYQPSPRRGTPT